MNQGSLSEKIISRIISSLKCSMPILLCSVCLSSCAHDPVPKPLTMNNPVSVGHIRIPRLHYQIATLQTPPVPPKIITRYVPVPTPGQLIPLPQSSPSTSARTPNATQGPTEQSAKNNHDPKQSVNAANKGAVQQPTKSNYINAIASFPYMDSALYQIYASPMRVTDIEMGPGEKISTVASGDSARWQVSKTTSGDALNPIEHLIVKPYQTDIESNMLITTNNRSYHLLLKSTTDTYMTAVRWHYPENDVLQFNTAANGSNNVSQGLPPVDMNHLDFNYRLYLMKGYRPSWTPRTVFNDGNKTYIQFPGHMQRLPVLFIATLNEKGKKIISPMNYRRSGNYFIVDGLFQVAELSVGRGQADPSAVQIVYQKRL